MRALRMPFPGYRISQILEREEQHEAIGFFKQLFPRLMTVRVDAKRSRTIAELRQHSSAFLFPR